MKAGGNQWAAARMACCGGGMLAAQNISLNKWRNG